MLVSQLILILITFNAIFLQIKFCIMSVLLLVCSVLKRKVSGIRIDVAILCSNMLLRYH